MKIDKDRLDGMFLGVFIGDAMGKPVESWTADRIAHQYKRLTTIESPSEHKYFKGQPAGTWSDDTQLTVVVAEAIIASGGVKLPDAMDVQAAFHAEALRKTDSGWGRSTRESIRRIANGLHWSKAGEPPMTNGKPGGAGNGVAMKISPLAAYSAVRVNESGSEEWMDVVDFAMDLAYMTHQTPIAACSGLAMMSAFQACLTANPTGITSADMDFFIDQVADSSQLAEEIYGIIHNEEVSFGDNLTVRLRELYNHAEYDQARIISEIKAGCYCYESIPFSLMQFVKNPGSIDALYDTINGGGDTDSNGSMVGGLLGALHGTAIFPKHLIDALDPSQKDIVLKTSEDFYAKFYSEIE